MIDTIIIFIFLYVVFFLIKPVFEQSDTAVIASPSRDTRGVMSDPHQGYHRLNVEDIVDFDDHAGDRDRYKSIEKHLDHSDVVWNQGKYSITLASNEVVTPLGKYKIGSRLGASENPWFSVDGESYRAIGPGDERVMITQFKQGYASNSMRLECERLLYLCSETVSPCPKLCTPVIEGNSILVTESFGRSIFHDMMRRDWKRYQVIEALRIGNRMLEKLSIMHNKAGIVHGSTFLSSWHYRFESSKYDPGRDDIVVLRAVDGRRMWDPLEVDAFRPSPKSDLYYVITAMIQLFTGRVNSEMSRSGNILFKSIDGIFPLTPCGEEMDDVIIEAFEKIGLYFGVLKNQDIPNYVWLQSILNRAISGIDACGPPNRVPMTGLDRITSRPPNPNVAEPPTTKVRDDSLRLPFRFR